MNLKLTTTLEGEALEAWILFLFEDEFTGRSVLADELLDHEIRRVIESKEFEPKPDKTLILRTLGRLPVARILISGLGKKSEVSLEKVHRAAAVGVRTLRETGCRRVGAALPPDLGLDPERATSAVAEGVVMGSYQFLKYKTPEEAPKKISEFYLEVPEDVRSSCERGLRRGEIVGGAANYAKDLANEPPVVATPVYVAGMAMALGSEKLRCTVQDEVAMAQQGMNAILMVGQGSANPPRMVTLEYRGGGEGAPVYAVVGKGITFDSGGMSIKPAAAMEEMKFDKSGACAVLGCMKAVAELELAVNVVGIAALAENLPSGTAYRPGDIIRAASGKTIEVLNTDAEGRVVLADAIHHAGTFGPSVIVDLATLTGACVVALGDLASGIMGNDDALARALIEAGETCGERLWQLPLWPEYDEKIKSEVADLKNLGERAGGRGHGRRHRGGVLPQGIRAFGVRLGAHRHRGDGQRFEEEALEICRCDRGRRPSPRGVAGIGFPPLNRSEPVWRPPETVGRPLDAGTKAFHTGCEESGQGTPKHRVRCRAGHHSTAGWGTRTSTESKGNSRPPVEEPMSAPREEKDEKQIRGRHDRRGIVAGTGLCGHGPDGCRHQGVRRQGPECPGPDG